MNSKIQVDSRGIRILDKFYGDGESWTRYAIIPRDIAVETIRKLKRGGRRYHDLDVYSLLQYILPDAFQSQHYGGPGRPFAGHIIRLTSSRRYIVFFQRGGLDI